MAHNINGIITSFKYEGNLPNVILEGDYYFIACETASSEKPMTPYEGLTLEVRDTIKDLSFYGKCAYIETAYFGGVGAQISETWEDGKKIEGPLISYDGIENKAEYEHVTVVDYSINQTLRNLGVHCQNGKDEFDTLGLGRYRSNRKILEEYEKSTKD